MDIEMQIRKNTAAKYRMAVIFGILAGIFYSAVAWGIDGYQLAQANAILPWLPFAIGAVICGLLGGVAGFFTYHFNHLFVTFVIWLLTGLAFSWIGNHMQVSLIPIGIRVLAPSLASQINFPVNETIHASQFLISVAVTGLCMLGGMLSINQIEGAVEASGLVPRLLAILVWGVIFSFAGFAVRDNISDQMAAPVIGANEHIQTALNYLGRSVDEKTASRLRLSAFKNIEDLITQPRRLALIGYDEMLTSMTVLVEFDGVPVHCYVLGKTVNFCKR